MKQPLEQKIKSISRLINGDVLVQLIVKKGKIKVSSVDKIEKASYDDIDYIGSGQE